MLKIGIYSVEQVFSNSGFRWVFGYKTSANNAGRSAFTVDYLVNSLGFSKEEAIIASTKASPLKSSANPDSVVNLFKTSGLNETQIKKVIFCVPRILSCDAEKTLKPKLEAFQDLGLYGSDLADVISVHPHIFLRALDGHIVPTLEVLKSIFKDDSILVAVLKKSLWVLGPSVPKTLPSNIALLKSYGLSMDKIKLMLLRKSRYFVLDTKWLQAILIRVEEKLGIPRGSPMFCHGVFAMGGMSKACFESKFEVFRSFGWSESDILTLARNSPYTLALSESKLKQGLNFFMKVIGYRPAEIASCACILCVSLERRVIPRYAVIEVLKEKQLIGPNYRLSSCLSMTQPKFFNKFVLPYKDEVLDLYTEYLRRVDSALRCAK